MSVASFGCHKYIHFPTNAFCTCLDTQTLLKNTRLHQRGLASHSPRWEASPEVCCNCCFQICAQVPPVQRRYPWAEIVLLSPKQLGRSRLQAIQRRDDRCHGSPHQTATSGASVPTNVNHKFFRALLPQFGQSIRNLQRAAGAKGSKAEKTQWSCQPTKIYTQNIWTEQNCRKA